MEKICSECCNKGFDIVAQGHNYDRPSVCIVRMFSRVILSRRTNQWAFWGFFCLVRGRNPGRAVWSHVNPLHIYSLRHSFIFACTELFCLILIQIQCASYEHLCTLKSCIILSCSANNSWHMQHVFKNHIFMVMLYCLLLLEHPKQHCAPWFRRGIALSE